MPLPCQGGAQPNFRQLERSCYEMEPDLQDILNQARQARAAGIVQVQSVAPMLLPVASVMDWDCQHKQHFDQTMAKRQSSPLDDEKYKQASTPPQTDPKDAPIRDHTQHEGHENGDWGCSRTRDRLDRQLELDRACSKYEVKAANAAKVGSALKAGGTVRAGAAAVMKCASPECGHPSEHAAQAGDALKKIGPADYRVPVPTVTSRTERLGAPHIRCPLKTKCPPS